MARAVVRGAGIGYQGTAAAMARLLPKILLAIATFAVCVGLMVAGAALRGRLVEAPGGSAPREPLTEAPAAPHALTAPPATGRPALEARNGDQPPVFPPSQFVRWPVGPDVVARYFEIDGELTVYDPYSYFRHRGNLDVERPWEEHPDGRWMLRTNSLGMRRDSEPAAERPDLRVLVVGDSHTDGVCDNDESYCALLEAALARSGERVARLPSSTRGRA